MRNKLTSDSVESVGQAVWSQIRQKVQTHHVWKRLGSVQDSVAGKASQQHEVADVIGTRMLECRIRQQASLLNWLKGRRLLVSTYTEGKLMTIESRQAEMRRALMAVKLMTQQGQRVCFGPDRAFAYKMETGRVIPFESTPNGWNFTVEHEAPNDANRQLQEVRNIM